MTLPVCRRGGGAELQVAYRVDADQWNLLAAAAGGGVFHNFHYGSTLYDPRVQTRIFAQYCGSDGGAGAVCLGAMTNTQRRPLMRVFSSAHVTAVPAARDPQLIETMLRSMVRMAAEAGVIALTVDGVDAPALSEAAVAGARTIQRAEFRVDLTRSAGDLWARVAKTRRAAVRRGDRESLVLRLGASLEDLLIVAALMRASADRARRRNGRGFDVVPLAKLQSLSTHLLQHGLATVYVAEKNGTPVSANVIAAWNGRAYNLLAGSSAEGFEVGAASWLYWRIIEETKAGGSSQLNLGGVASAGEPGGPGHGLFDFKRDFGGDLVACPTLVYILRPWRFSAYQRLQRACGIARQGSAAA